jgi:hypothetical protein
MDPRTTEILNWLDELANKYSLQLDKRQKMLAEDAIKIIMRQTLEPVPDEQPKFRIPPELENMHGSSVVGVDA